MFNVLYGIMCISLLKANKSYKGKNMGNILKHISYTNYINDLRSIANIIEAKGDILEIIIDERQSIKIDIDAGIMYYIRVLGMGNTNTVKFKISELIDKSNALGDLTSRGILLITMKRAYNLVNIKFRLTMGETKLKKAFREDF